MSARFHVINGSSWKHFLHSASYLPSLSSSSCLLNVGMSQVFIFDLLSTSFPWGAHPIPWLRIALMISDFIVLLMTLTVTKLNSWCCPSLMKYISSPSIAIFEISFSPFYFLTLIKNFLSSEVSSRGCHYFSTLHIPQVLCSCLQLPFLVPIFSQLLEAAVHLSKASRSGTVFLYPELLNTPPWHTRSLSFKNPLGYTFSSRYPICLPSSRQNFPQVWTAAILSSFCLTFSHHMSQCHSTVLWNRSLRDFLVYLFKFRAELSIVSVC